MKLRSKFKLVLLYLVWSFSASAELQTTLSLSAPTLTPGTSGSFTATQVTGPAASETGTMVNPYAGVIQYVLSNGTGRFSSLSGTTYGIQIDTFEIFRSFLNNIYYSMLSSGTTCPASSTTYDWLMFRMRSPDAPRSAMVANSTSTFVGGTLNYNPSSTPVFSSTTSFDMVGPNVYSTSYSYDNSSFGACSSGSMKAVPSGTVPADTYAQFFFGNSFAVEAGSGGNPTMSILMPQQTLTSTTMSNLANNVLSGLFTIFSSKSAQTQQNLYVVPNAAGTTFTLNTINNFSDPTQYTNYGTLTCTSLNSPAAGFCQGTLSLVGVTGTSNAICEVGSTSIQTMLSCVFDMPNAPTEGGTLIATQSNQSLVSVSVPSTIPNVTVGGSTTIIATIQNLTGAYISTMSDPSSPSLKLTPPFSDPGAYTVSNGGTCLGTLKGYASCTVNLTFAPTSAGTTLENFRVAYNNNVTTVNGTAGVTAAAGLTSIVVTPNTAYLAQGSTQQYTATGHYSDGSTQNLTSVAAWSSNATSVASISSSGLATMASAGAFTISALYAGVTGTVNSNVYVPPPNPTGLTATPASYTQINLSWTSGGGSTTAFQIAYQSGSSAPANCTAGTVITSGTVGLSTSFSVTGLQPGTQYSFIVCSENGSSGAFSTGVTASATTTVPHTVFATSGTYQGNLGGLYFADYACYKEAVSAGLSGTWKAVMSDQSTSATSRISLSKSVYNARPLGSGGPLLVSTSAGFWAQPLSNAVTYNASGGSPGVAQSWTGSTTTGTIVSGQNCSSWTTSSSGSTAEYGTNTTVNAQDFQTGTSACNNSYSLYCINLQTSTPAPPDPATFSWYQRSSTSIEVIWTSGGSYTAAYQLVYKAGSIPTFCSDGTVVPAATLGLNPTSYTVTGLTASTTYGFRLCAMNGDLSNSSSGSTTNFSIATTASGTVTNLGTTQIVFTTTNTYQGSFGGIYFGDFICQNEASSAGLSGVWKAILSSDTVAAASHVSFGGTVYNNRPASSGGIQQVAASSSAFYTSPLAQYLYYNASGTTPGQTVAWTGSTAAGAINTGNTCTSWTTANSAIRGEYGNSSNVTNAIASSNNPCNNSYSLFCTNQQTSSGVPNAPLGFTWYVASNNSISLSWSSGGGYTAGYQLVYQAGSAPTTCTGGTVVSPSTLGVNPTSYTVTGLSASTTYGFTLCAINSDQTQYSTPTSFTQSTVSSSQGPIQNLSNVQVVFTTASTYTGAFGGLYFADFICQNEANANNLGGVWKAILSDNSTAASSRITISSNIYNNRPYSSGGIQQVAANSASFWSSSLAYSMNYNGGGTNPGNANPWTGSTAAGAVSSSNNCSS